MYSYAISLGSLAHEFDLRWERSFEQSHIRDVEIILKDLANPTAAAACRRMVKNGIVRVASIHLPFWEYDFSSLDETERRGAISQITRLLEDNADFLSTSNMTVHCSKEPAEAEREAHFAPCIRSITELLPLIKQFGATLNIEFLPRSCIGNKESELLRIANEFDPVEVGICMDVNHVMNRNAELPEIIEKLASRIRTFHLSDFDGFDERHWFVGDGIIDWVKVMAAIRKVPGDPVLIFETDAILNGAYTGRKIPADPIFTLRHMDYQKWYLENCEEINKRIWPSEQ